MVIAFGASLVFCHAAALPPKTATPHEHLDGGVAEIDAAPSSGTEPGVTAVPDEDPTRWTAIDALVQAALDEGKMPGCVVVVGRHDEVLFEKAYGARSVVPQPTAMTTETVFDIASLTKPVSTATSIMILADRGKIDLDARASRYVPELVGLPPFTVRQLLVHTSGLPAGAATSRLSPNRAEVMRYLGSLTLKAQPGEQFTYSDVGFTVLQEIVERVSGKTLSAFAADEIFAPLGMKETGYLPAADLRASRAHRGARRWHHAGRGARSHGVRPRRGRR
jgi:CubicO group peptidase (beta-lactamase class C family)